MQALPEMRYLAQSLCRGLREKEYSASETSLDWLRLIYLARFHGVRPLLTTCVTNDANLKKIDIPVNLLTEIKSWRSSFLVTTLMQNAAMLELQREFDRHGLTVVFWKGPSLHQLLYRGIPMREAADLDFLFYEEDLPHILKITEHLGYSGPNLATERDRYNFSHQHEYDFYRSRDSIALEFHAQIMTARFASWQDSRNHVLRANTRLPLGDTQMLLERPEDLLVSLTVHALKHGWNRLKWSYDIAQFMRLYGTTLNWHSILMMLARNRKDSVVLLGIALSSLIFETPLPPPVAIAIRRVPHIQALASSLVASLMSGNMTPITEEQEKELDRLLCPRLWDRLVYVFWPILHLEYEDLLIPESNRLLFPLNYPYRALRLLKQHGMQRLLSLTSIYLRSAR